MPVDEEKFTSGATSYKSALRCSMNALKIPDWYPDFRTKPLEDEFKQAA